MRGSDARFVSQERITRISCSQVRSTGFKRKSEYAYVPSLGLYFRLAFEESNSKDSVRGSERMRDFKID